MICHENLFRTQDCGGKEQKLKSADFWHFPELEEFSVCYEDKDGWEVEGGVNFWLISYGKIKALFWGG